MKTCPLSILEASEIVAESPTLYSIVLGDYEYNTPVSWDKSGKVISVFGYDEWDYSVWANRSEKIRFNRNGILSSADVYLIKKLCALALFGPKTNSLRTIRHAFYDLQCFAEHLTKQDHTLNNHPNVGRAIKNYLNTPDTSLRAEQHLKFFMRLALYNPKAVGWNPPPLSTFENSNSKLEKDSKRQTLYIPSTNYESILDQSIIQLENFLAISEKFTRFCSWFGNHSKTFWERPGNPKKTIRPLNNSLYGTHFFETKTRDFGIYEWIQQNNPPRKKINSKEFTEAVRSVRQAATVVLSATTFMRIGEVLSVKLNGLNKDHDDRIGWIYYVSGITTKTKKQRNAIWTTSPDAQLCFDACRLINHTYFKHFYMNASREALLKKLDRLPLFIQLPRLMLPSNPTSNERADVTIGRFYGRYLSEYLKPCLTLSSLAIDELLAVNTDYGTDEFTTGTNLPLAHHQFRRTGLVRAAASGVVSHPSLTYQAKHLDPQHTNYYLTGYLHSILAAAPHASEPLNSIVEQLDESIKTDFEKSYFDVLMWSHKDMKSNRDRFFSPYGEKHLDKLVNELEILSWDVFKRREKLKTAKRTLLGACLKDGYCEYGTAESIKGCVHHEKNKPCSNAVYDATNLERITEHLEFVRSELSELDNHEENSLLRESLIADEKAAIAALDEINRFLESK